MRALAENLGEPLERVIEEFLFWPGQGRYTEMIHQGALDLLAAHAGELEPDRLRSFLTKAIQEGSAVVRKTTYTIGLHQFGRDFAAPALDDPAKVVRTWAIKALDPERGV